MVALVNYLLQALRHVFCASGDAVLPLCPQDIVLVKQGLQLFLLPLCHRKVTVSKMRDPKIPRRDPLLQRKLPVSLQVAVPVLHLHILEVIHQCAQLFLCLRVGFLLDPFLERCLHLLIVCKRNDIV